jgi:hypothetical protein
MVRNLVAYLDGWGASLECKNWISAERLLFLNQKELGA